MYIQHLVKSPARAFVNINCRTLSIKRTSHIRSPVIMTGNHSYTTKQEAPMTPRPSASLVLMNAKNEVLLVHRVNTATSFANAHVFPGGNLDSSQDGESYELCAIRETFEETGLLLTKEPIKKDSNLKSIREEIHSGKLRFVDWLNKENISVSTDALIPFTAWETPKTMKKRYFTKMFLTFLPSHLDATPLQEMTMPTSDGGREIISTTFLSPTKALEAMHAKSIIFFPPQAYLLTRLEPFAQSSGNDAQKHITEWLKKDNMGQFVFKPRPEGKTKDGRVILGYGEEGDPMRKSIVSFGKGGMPSDVQIVKVEELAKL